MNILFHISTAPGGALLLPLAQAAKRANASFAAFFTHEGVTGLNNDALRAVLGDAQRVVVCEESWHRYCPNSPCPVETGSQTINSALMGEAEKVVSL